MSLQHSWAVTLALRNHLNVKGHNEPENAAGRQAAFNAILPASGVPWALLAIPETSVALAARDCATAAQGAAAPVLRVLAEDDFADAEDFIQAPIVPNDDTETTLGGTETSIALGTDSDFRGAFSAAYPAESQATADTTADDSTENVKAFFPWTCKCGAARKRASFSKASNGRKFGSSQTS
jgi:hypothetical protein